MNEIYIYPHNLKSQAKLWFWNLRDVAIIGAALLISVLALACHIAGHEIVTHYLHPSLS